MEDRQLLNILNEHYTKGMDDNDMRRLRENGWNDIIKAYYGKLPDNWPYLAMVSDPVIRTTILEKTSRLFNGRLRGRLTPREDRGDVVKAKINNAVLEYQWDSANKGGSMIEKWALMDTQARLFGASFGLAYWRVAEEDGTKTFEGNEFKVLDNRDIIVDYTASHVRDANWVQVREWKTLDDLEDENERSPEPIYKNLDVLKDVKGDRREVKYESMIKDLRGLEDRVGDDPAYPTFEVVTEYRCDRWITFLPRLNLIIRDIKNPFKHKRIPVVQLRYYGVGDDIYGESEVEPVLPLWRAINAILCGTIDEVNLRQRPPVKITNDAGVRVDSIEYGPNALWYVGSSINNVQEATSAGDVINNFQVVYSALKSAFSNAMGDMSQGVSQVDPFQPDKTATEIKATEKQRVSRDQYNQLYLEQSLKDMMMLWLSNNQQFLFDDPMKRYQVIRITGRDTIKDLQQMQLDKEEMDKEAMLMIADMIKERGGEMTDGELKAISKMAQRPTYPVITNPEADEMEYDVRTKMEVDENGESATLYMVPEDIEGMYDYIPDIQSMALNSSDERKNGRIRALELIVRPDIKQQLAEEGEKAQIKDLLIAVLEGESIDDAERFFEKQPNPVGTGQLGAVPEAQGINPAEGMVGPTPDVLGQGEISVPQPAGLQ